MYDHFRITMYNELLSYIVVEHDERFVNNHAHKTALGFLYMLPMFGEVKSEHEIPK